MSFPTWSDLNDDSLIPPLGRGVAPDLGAVALMVSTDLDFRYIQSNCGKITIKPSFFMGNLFTFNHIIDNPIDSGITVENYKLNNEKLHFDTKQVAVAGPYLGSPSAVMILESLIARGVSKVVVVGWCGAISDTLKIGDILIPNSAICDEGTSRNYIDMPADTDFPTVLPSPNFATKLKLALESNGLFKGNINSISNINKGWGSKYKIGKIWTTDAIYRETAKKVAFFKNMGAVAVEMECSALFSVAKYRKIEIAAILIVSDTLTSTEWKAGFKEARFKEARKKTLSSIVNVAMNKQL